MKRFLILVGLVISNGCTHLQSPQIPSGPVKLAMLYQSGRLGEIEPCSCQHKPHGGIDREANAVLETRKMFENVLYVDAGNSLAPLNLDVKQIINQQNKAGTLLKMLAAIGADVFSPGPAEYSLGKSFLAAQAKTVSFPFVSTNVENETGAALFERFAVVNKGGVRIGFLSLTPVGKDPLVKDPEATLVKWLPEVKRASDLVVILSQLPMAQMEMLTQKYPDINVVVGGDLAMSLDKPLWFAGHGLLVETPVNGHVLGQLVLDVRLPMKGFYSPSEVVANQERLAGFMEMTRASDEKTKALGERNRDRMLRQDSLEVIPEGTTYENQAIALTKEAYGSENVVTVLMSEYKESVRQRALAE